MVLEPATDGVPPAATPEALHAELARLRGENAALRAELERARSGDATGRRHQLDLLTSFSHDMRTSLNDITGFASILDDEIPGNLNARQRGFLGKIIGGADRLLRLVENLVADGSLHAGEAGGPRLPTDVQSLVGEAVEPLRPMADNKMTRIQVHVEVPGRPALDRRGVGLVLSNLVSNALQQNGLGGMIDVGAHLDGDAIRFEVRDYGPGLTEDALAALSKAADEPVHGAREFGMALGRRVIEAHGGELGVENAAVGTGTIVWFRLPYLEAPPAAEGAIAA